MNKERLLYIIGCFTDEIETNIERIEFVCIDDEPKLIFSVSELEDDNGRQQ